VEINRGMQLAIQALCKMLGLSPQIMENSVVDISKSLHSTAADMATIRRQNSAIMAHLGIAEPFEGEHDGRPDQHINGKLTS
jgi:hypothetical protein